MIITSETFMYVVKN